MESVCENATHTTRGHIIRYMDCQVQRTLIAAFQPLHQNTTVHSSKENETKDKSNQNSVKARKETSLDVGYEEKIIGNVETAPEMYATINCF